MKIKYTNQKGKEAFIEEGSHIIIVSFLEDKKNRHAYVLECNNPTKVLIQMETTSDRQNTAVKLKIKGKEILIKNDYQAYVNVISEKIKILATKKGKISKSEIIEIKAAAEQERKNWEIKCKKWQNNIKKK